jgi:hypothetical protein
MLAFFPDQVMETLIPGRFPTVPQGKTRLITGPGIPDLLDRCAYIQRLALQSNPDVSLTAMNSPRGGPLGLQALNGPVDSTWPASPSTAPGMGQEGARACSSPHDFRLQQARKHLAGRGHGPFPGVQGQRDERDGVARVRNHVQGIRYPVEILRFLVRILGSSFLSGGEVREPETGDRPWVRANSLRKNCDSCERSSLKCYPSLGKVPTRSKVVDSLPRAGRHDDPPRPGFANLPDVVTPSTRPALRGPTLSDSKWMALRGVSSSRLVFI